MNLMGNLQNNFSPIWGFLYFILVISYIISNRVSNMALHQLFVFTFFCAEKNLISIFVTFVFISDSIRI